MSRIVGDEPCPSCRAVGRDSTGNHLINFEDGGKHCSRCGFTVKSGEEYEKEETNDNTMNREEKFIEAKSYQIKELSARGIGKEAANFYRIRTEMDTVTGEDLAYYYPLTKDKKLIAYHVRVLPKKFDRIGVKTKGKKVDLFGQYRYNKGGNKILLVGGQDDMAAAWQMLREYNKSKSQNYIPVVVGVSSGENAKSVSDNLDFLLSYKEIIICMDNDAAGKKATDKISKLIGPKSKIMELPPGEDPNSMLQKGKSKEFVSAFFSAKGYQPDNLLSVEDVWEEAIKMPEWGRHWPWPSLDKLTYGRRNGEGIYVGAGTKVGKTEWLSEMVHHILFTEEKPVLLFKFEQTPGETLKALAGKHCHKRFNKPDGDFTQEELIQGIESLKGKVYLYKMYMNEVGDNEAPWDRMKPIIRYATEELGVEDIFIDPITQLTDGMEGGETDTHLRRFSNELAGMSMEHNFFYYCFCHLKAPQQGKSHEEGANVRPYHFRGSRAMMEKTKYLLGIQRDLYAEDETERNTSKFVLLLNSGFGNTGSFDVFYDKDTGSYLESNFEEEEQEVF